jgi:hypothetical protein
MKTVRNSVEHFSFFLLPFSFFFEREKKILARQEGRRKKEAGRRNTLILLMFHYAHSSHYIRFYPYPVVASAKSIVTSAGGNTEATLYLP